MPSSRQISPNSIEALNKFRPGEGKRQAVLNHLSLIYLIKALQDGTMSCRELAEDVGLHYVTVLNFCRIAHREKLIHIHMWEKDQRGRDLIKIYKFGPGRDAKRTRKSDAERQATYRAKKQAANLLNSIVIQPEQ